MADAGGPIVAIGGAEFSMRPENEALHDYVLSLAAVEEPRICLLPTAGGDHADQIAAFHRAMDRRSCVASTLSLFRLGQDQVDPAAHLATADVIYVGGGSMVNLLALWREHGIEPLLRDAHRRGAVLCGYSAGSMCWFEHGISRGTGRLSHAPGLGLLAGSHCVHYSQDPGRRAAYRRLIAAGEIPAGLALDDHAAALFRDRHLVETVRSRGAAGAWMVERDGDSATESGLECSLLEAPGRPVEQGLDEMRELRRMRAATTLGGRRPGRGA